MYERYQKDLLLAKNKLLTINFLLEKDDDYIATFGNGTIWKIDFNGKWYDDYSYISIRNETINSEVLDKKGFPVWMLMKIFGVYEKNMKTEDKLDFIINYKDKIFDDAFQYKKLFENIKKDF